MTMWPLDPGAPAENEEEPDYRFTLANERTFLAWIRAALALIAGTPRIDQQGVGPVRASRRSSPRSRERLFIGNA